MGDPFSDSHEQKEGLDKDLEHPRKEPDSLHFIDLTSENDSTFTAGKQVDINAEKSLGKLDIDFDILG